MKGLQVRPIGFQEDFLGRDQTESIKGFFLIFVFIRHAFQYVQKSGYEFSSMIDLPMKVLNNQLGQLIVVMFLFYSGYGILESVKKSGETYLKDFPYKRIFPTIINFDIAVLIFLIVGIACAKEFSCLRVVQAFLGWESVGNSNWYIFDIVVCYILFWISFFLTKRKGVVCTKPATMVLVIALLFFIVGMSFVKQTRWYNTVLAFGGGVFFSVYKDYIILFLKKKYWMLFGGLTIVIIILKAVHYDLFCFRFNVLSLCFAIWIVMATMKIKMQNNALIWMGRHLFPLYIYQRLPMNILYDFNDGAFVRDYPLIYIAVCFVITVVISYFYRYWQVKVTTQKTL